MWPPKTVNEFNRLYWSFSPYFPKTLFEMSGSQMEQCLQRTPYVVRAVAEAAGQVFKHLHKPTGCGA